jgi:hypothetical protein
MFCVKKHEKFLNIRLFVFNYPLADFTYRSKFTLRRRKTLGFVIVYQNFNFFLPFPIQPFAVDV